MILNAWFWDRPAVAGFRGLGGPGGRENLCQKVGRFAPRLLEGCSGAAKTSKIDEFRSVQKQCIKILNVESREGP